MNVINTAIRVTQGNQDDHQERTVKEIFTQFNEQLFWLVQQQQFEPLINSLD